MKRLFERLLPAAVFLALTATIAWSIASLVGLFLPPLPITECRPTLPSFHHDYPFARAFGLRNRPAAPKRKRAAPVPTVSLKGYQLTMTAVGRPSMAIIIHNGKSKLLSVGESIDGFRLDTVETDRVKLVKGGREYWLTMKKKKTRSIHTSQSASSRKHRKVNARESSELVEQIRQEGDTYYIPRELLKEFHDVKKIFRYIAIKPIYRDNKLIGFGVSKVKKGSVFDKMGLRKRDIIQKINGEPLTSETQAFKYFNKIDELSSLSMTIKRGSEEKELHYEIF